MVKKAQRSAHQQHVACGFVYNDDFMDEMIQELDPYPKAGHDRSQA